MAKTVIMKNKSEISFEQLRYIVKTPKCKSYQCNHLLDPEEWDCDEKKCIETGECKYLNQ